MAITTYAELQTAIEGWLDRDELTNVADFITLFEAAANRRLRVRQMEDTESLAPSSGSAALPADFLTWRRVTWEGTPSRDLEYVHPSYMTLHYPTTADEPPKFFTIEGANLKTGSNDATAITLAYYGKVPALSDAATTNWLLTAHPDLYLFGSLCEAEMFLVGDQRAATWKARRDEIMEEIKMLDQKHRGPSAIRVTGATP
jgi:hypothetical protein